MKKVSIIGNGYHTKKNLLHAISNDKDFKINKVYSDVSKNYDNKYYKYLSKEIEKDTSNLLVLSTPPSSHLEILQNLKKIKIPIVIEKPFSNSFENVKKMLGIINTNQMNVIEGLMYLHHPFVSNLKSILINEEVKKIEANFTIPFPEKNNFRIESKFDGGSLLDTGVYIFSLLHFLGGDNFTLKDLAFKNNLESEGTINSNVNNFKFTGSWGFGEYSNNLKVSTTSHLYEFEYFFSKPITKRHIINIYKNQKLIDSKDFSENNHFIMMYINFLNDYKNEDFSYENYNNILSRWKLINKAQNIILEKKLLK
jgi:predicted dehydrogenase